MSIRLKGVTFRSFGRGVRGVLAWKEAGRRLIPAGARCGARGEPEEDRIGDKDPTELRPDPRPATLLLRSSRSCLWVKISTRTCKRSHGDGKNNFEMYGNYKYFNTSLSKIPVWRWSRSRNDPGLLLLLSHGHDLLLLLGQALHFCLQEAQ